ncbi:MAG: 2-octaprenylphenol hydroxylase [Gammaproteobacteria bacterium]|jgi:2-octaprenylphenol hydroxylase
MRACCEGSTREDICRISSGERGAVPMNYDVAVVGGGAVGLTLACALGDEGVRVALIESRAAPEPVLVGSPAREHFDLRTIAITPVSQRILEALGVWQRLPAQRLGAFEHMCVWDTPGRGEVHFDAVDADLPVLGHIVENRELVHALEQRAATLDTVRMYRPATLHDLQAGPHGVTLELDGARLQARLVAGADGAHSRVRELAGITADVRAYQQHALVAMVRTACPHQATAWQRFLPRGPLAFLPLPDNWCSVVWSSSPEHAAELERMDEVQFREALGSAYDERLGAVVEVTGRGRFELMRVQAHRYLAPRVVLLGDAAHTIHPLAGQGVNLGLLDAAVLAERVASLIAAQRDPGIEGDLRAYERSRRGHNLLTGELMTGFNRLFGARFAPAGAARNFALAIANRTPLLRRLCINYASGLSFELPKLAQQRHRL